MVSAATGQHEVATHGRASVRQWVEAHPLAVFVVLAYVLSWSYWIPLALGTRTVESGIGWPTQMPGLLGPAISAVIVTAIVGGRAGLIELRQRMTRWRVGWWWLSVVAIVVAGAVGIAISGGVDHTRDLTIYNGIATGVGPLATIAMVFVLNGIGEETGWRGFLADGLLKRHSLTVTSLLVALVWAPWHTPLFFFQTSFKDFTVAQVVGWAIGLTAGSFVLTWLYRGSGASILLVVVWHTAFNFTSATPATEGAAAAISSTLVMVAAVAIAVADWRHRRHPPSVSADPRLAGSADTTRLS